MLVQAVIAMLLNNAQIYQYFVSNSGYHKL